MKFNITIRTAQADSETRYTVAAPDFQSALSQVGYDLAAPDIRQVLITRIQEDAKVLQLKLVPSKLDE